MRDQATDPRRRRLLGAAIAGGAALLAVIGVGVWGLVRGPATGTTPAQSGSASASASSPSASHSAGVTGPEAIGTVSAPDVFARAVARALFTWDTASRYGPADYAQVLSDAADSSEADALAGDVRGYLPSTDAWAQLRTYQTRQWLTIDTVVIPQAWATARAQAAPGQLPAGTTAYTITGTRHRTGTWDTQPVETTHPVSFTVFLTCHPTAPDHAAPICRLLRLSAPDQPLH